MPIRRVACATAVSAGVIWVVGGAVAQDRGPARNPSKDPLEPVQARAEIRSCVEGKEVTGFALLTERPSAEGVKQVDVTVAVTGLPDGKHAVHIHENGACTAAPANADPTTRCMSAGGHFDPGPNGNSQVDANHPFHSGDLQNIEIKNGMGTLQTTTSRITLSPGPLSVFAKGSAIMIHDLPDTYCPNGNQARCAGGTRAACGVLTRVR
jgi:Cu-Zn family superoxide dismutase